MPYYYYNSTGLLPVLLCALFALWASHNVNSTFKKYAKQFSVRGITGAQAAQRVLSANGVYGVKILRVDGNLTDHFDPGKNMIFLSDGVYDSASTAAIGVACHEAGHAAQHATGYVPIKIRNAIIPVCNFGSRFGIPLALVGMFVPNHTGTSLILAGLALYAFVALFQFATLPVELNASRRALKVIGETGLLDGREKSGAREVLIAAAMTYVVAVAASLADLFRMIILFLGNRRE